MGVLVASTIAGLGTPEEDGAHGLLRTSHVELPLTWNLANEVWLGRPAWTMRINDTIGFNAPGGTGWKYPGAFSEQPSPEFNPVSQNFRIHKILYAGELWAAGARLQEHLTAQMKLTGSGSGDSAVALAWYPLELGEDFLSPQSFNHGVRVVRPEGISGGISGFQVFRFFSSGWQNNVTTGDGEIADGDTGVGVLNVPPTLTEHLYPEVYQVGPNVSVRNFTALHRWAGGPGLGGAGSAEKAFKFPPTAAAPEVRGWYRADHAGGTIVGGTVSELPDFSGFAQALRQPTSANRPLLTTDGSLGGKQFLRFDGTNDALCTDFTPIPLYSAEPGGPMSPHLYGGDITIYFVMRQRNTGATQQVWLSKAGSGAMLIYRGDNTNQVNIWRGGADFTYNRANNWSQPMPWTIWSLATSGSDTSVWENDVEVADGTAGGGAGLSGITLGSNGDLSLPAAIDVAELILCIGEHDDTQRNAMVDYLNDKYAIF